eukprot:CAMPEP_0178442236 /NCGR_PEP_ID=MMETSP0689_2-20121128/38029_1 /TAXON_ID=160604 /ORGANISM="Amphidinium massartii, Strain CS-259" /LENGTH=99 /DNA_ID=CAMNT_0020065713 /DNA_START=194 /DNA_END=491 /DNA_ORIENTATION=-
MATLLKDKSGTGRLANRGSAILYAAIKAVVSKGGTPLRHSDNESLYSAKLLGVGGICLAVLFIWSKHLLPCAGRAIKDKAEAAEKHDPSTKRECLNMIM